MPVFQKGDVRILFVHVPKAGGTSIEHFFLLQDWKMSFFDSGEDEPSINPVAWCSPQHFHASILEAIFDVKRFSYFFTVVRDPISRIKSEIRWQCKYLAASIDPESWIDDSLESFKQDPFIYDNHIRPQVEFIFNDLNIFQLENGLDQVAHELTRRFPQHFTDTIAVPTAMRSGDDDVALPKRTIRKLEEFYGEDYAELNYRRIYDEY